MSKVLPIVFALLVQHKVVPQKEKAPPVVYTVFDEGDEVTARLTRPDGEPVTVRKADKFGNLHGVRKHFVPEIIKTAENVD
jgi:hypothetical protein